MAKANTPSTGGEKPAENPTSRASTAAAKPKTAGKTTAKTAKPTVKTDADKAPAPSSSTASTPSTAKAASTGAAKTSTVAKPAEKVDAPKADSPKPAEREQTVIKAETATTESKAEKTPAAAKAAAPATPSSPDAVKAAPEKRASVFFPLMLGGLVAGGIGFAAAEMDLLGLRGETDTQTPLVQDLAALEGRIATLEQSTAEPAPDTSAIDSAIADLTARVDEIANRPAPVAGEASQLDTSGLEADLAALKTSVEIQRAEIQKMLEDALSVEEATEQAAQSAAAQTALARIVAAVSTGQPFAAEIADLQANGVQDVPPALTDAAETGVVTMTNLQDRFPDAARDALTAVRADAPAGTGGGLGQFLKNQLGARSVTPRAGDDPDAILSRVEDAMRRGQLAEALTEVDALPDGAKAPLADWIADAQTRQAAQDALDTLSQRLTAN
ncbi:hypothetical protein [Sulfitobacter sp. AS59]|uniref:COG4223 family protein n=1 Tax=Sulfitobacter sp. AS59 TaxID=3135784 RepID=UPI00319E4FBF